MTIPESKPIKGWWFGEDILPNGDGRAVTEGCTLRVEPPIVLCRWGLHFSYRLLDALTWAKGAKVWRVEGWGESVNDAYKIACEYRRHCWCLDISVVLRRFACREALRVLPADAPERVREYLKLADKASEAQRRAARSAAGNAAWSAARDAAWSAARSAASEAAYSAAWEEAGSAACDAAWSAAWYEAWNEVRARQARSLESMVRAARRAATQSL